MTLAGFASLIAVLRNRSVSQWHPRVRFNFWLTLGYSLNALLLSLIPSLAADVGIVSWSVPIVLFLLTASAVAYFVARENRKLRAAGHAPRALATWIISWVLAWAAIGVLVLGFVGIWVAPSGAYHFGVCIVLILAALSFVATLQYPVEEA